MTEINITPSPNNPTNISLTNNLPQTVSLTNIEQIKLIRANNSKKTRWENVVEVRINKELLFVLVFCENTPPSTLIPATISQFLLTYSADHNSVTWCDNSAPSTLIAEEISQVLLTYGANYNSVTWCDNSAPSTLIAAT